MIEAIEQAICDRLVPLREIGVLTRALPSKPGEYGQANGSGSITVRWNRDIANPPITEDVIVQTVLSEWILDVKLPSLRDEAGAQTVVQQIVNLLVGWQPPNCKKLYLKSRQSMGQAEKLWAFELVFIAPTLMVEQLGETGGVEYTGDYLNF